MTYNTHNYYQTRDAVRTQAPARIVIYGWYGIPNVGDEAILASIVADLRRLLPSAHITVFSYDPEHTLQHHHVDDALRVPRHLSFEQKRQIWRTLRQTDLFILGGGGMFHTTSGRRPWLEKLAWAKLLGCQTMLYAVGIDPSAMAKARWRLVWRLFSRFADVITVRDEGSRHLLRSAGVTKPAAVIPDPAFRLTPSQDAGAAILQSTIGDADSPLVSMGVGMPPYRFGALSRYDYVEVIASAGDHVVEQFGARVVLVPYDMQPGRDRELCLEVLGMMEHRAHGCVLLNQYTPNEILALNDHVSLSICTRFHSLIFALMSATPFVSIVYQQKVRELLHETALSDFGISFADLSAKNLNDTIDAVWAKRTTLEQTLPDIVAPLAHAAVRAPETATELVTSRVPA